MVALRGTWRRHESLRYVYTVRICDANDGIRSEAASMAGGAGVWATAVAVRTTNNHKDLFCQLTQPPEALLDALRLFARLGLFLGDVPFHARRSGQRLEDILPRNRAAGVAQHGVIVAGRVLLHVHGDDPP